MLNRGESKKANLGPPAGRPGSAARWTARGKEWRSKASSRRRKTLTEDESDCSIYASNVSNEIFPATTL
jgi:hypothetical protein